MRLFPRRSDAGAETMESAPLSTYTAPEGEGGFGSKTPVTLPGDMYLVSPPGGEAVPAPPTSISSSKKIKSQTPLLLLAAVAAYALLKG